jgi:hypothetical protein
MMIGVQTVCPAKPGPLWGQTVTSGAADNCSVNQPASPACPD